MASDLVTPSNEAEAEASTDRPAESSTSERLAGPSAVLEANVCHPAEPSEDPGAIDTFHPCIILGALLTDLFIYQKLTIRCRDAKKALECSKLFADGTNHGLLTEDNRRSVLAK